MSYTHTALVVNKRDVAVFITIFYKRVMMCEHVGILCFYDKNRNDIITSFMLVCFD